MKKLIGKTIAGANYIDPWDRGLLITFTDGTTLRVTERMQSGEIQVNVDDDIAEYEQGEEE